MHALLVTLSIFTETSNEAILCYICAISYHSCKFYTRKNNRVFKKALLKKEEVSISAEDSVIIVALYLCLADWRVDVYVRHEDDGQK